MSHVSQSARKQYGCQEDTSRSKAWGCGGDDCRDTKPDVNPGMTEISWNGIDDDCNPATPAYPTSANAITVKSRASRLNPQM